MVPPAPGRFSMTMGCPSWGESLSVTVRAMMSVPLPGVNGTMILIGFEGQACACAPTCRAQSASAATDLPSFPDILASRAGRRAAARPRWRQTAFQNYQSASLLDVFEFDASLRTEACASLLDAHLILNASQRERKLSEPVT